jgi:hypothetical protein
VSRIEIKQKKRKGSNWREKMKARRDKTQNEWNKEWRTGEKGPAKKRGKNLKYVRKELEEASKEMVEKKDERRNKQTGK